MLVPAIAAALAVSPVSAQSAAEPLEMTPSSVWEADYGEDSCALRRAFKSGEDEAILQLRQFGPGDIFEVTLASRTLSRTNEAPRVRFEPDESFFEPSQPEFIEEGDLHGVFYTDSLRPVALKPLPGPFSDWSEAERQARERAITGLSIIRSFERDLILRTGRMDQAMSAMRACLDDLLAQWGIDPTQQRSLSRPPQPIDLTRWARRIQSSYPSDMLQVGRGGRVHISLVVGADGKPTSCIPQGYANPSFKEHACGTTMRYARFEPALNADGAPVSSLYAMTLDYGLF